ncbi:hypothetical protein Gpo141_00003110 [Globisporangium polare]
MVAIAQVAAKPTFPARLPNGANVVDVDALGHVDTSGGGELNAFGSDFKNVGLTWTTALCEADSDGDGQTNGQELGDPCCKWVAKSNEKVQWTTGVSHPGDASSTSDPSLWTSVTCGVTSAAASPSSNATASSNSATAATKAPTSTTSSSPTAMKTPSTSTTPAPSSSTNTTSTNSTANTTTSGAAATSTTSLTMVFVAVAVTVLTTAVFA